MKKAILIPATNLFTVITEKVYSSIESWKNLSKDDRTMYRYIGGAFLLVGLIFAVMGKIKGFEMN